MSDAEDTLDREDGPPDVYIDPPIPAHPRPGWRVITATTAEYGRWRLSRVGLDLDDAIEEEVEDYKNGLAGHLGCGGDAATYAADQPDVALWEGERCLAVVRPRVGGDPEVTRFDGRDDERPLPEPSTDLERQVWGMVKEYGAGPCREALVVKFIRDGRRQPTADALSEAEGMALRTIRRIGEREAMDRLYLAGAYQVIWDTVGRLGSDAVAELRRIIAATGTVAVQSATVIGPEAPAESPEEVAR